MLLETPTAILMLSAWAIRESISELLTLFHVAPPFVLLYRPFAPAFVYSTSICIGSLASEEDGPLGSPVPAEPETFTHVPGMVQRHTPKLSQLPPASQSSLSFTVKATVCPAGAIPETLRPFNASVPATAVHEAPPLVVRSKPMRRPPYSKRLLNRPAPATRVS